MLALSGELDYRSAHKVVGRAVRDLVDAGELAVGADARAPRRRGRGRPRPAGRRSTSAALRDALDPAACAAARRQTGSSSEAAMDAMLADIDEALTAHAAWSDGAREREAAAEAALLDRARELAASA